jgi:predicted dehydrogenase
MEGYRAGIIGCGGIARAHARGYQEAGIALVAAADPLEEARHRWQHDFPECKVYADYTEMLANEGLDLVSVCTWPPLRVEPVVAAAKAGSRGIACEKPIALDLGQADAMLAACDQHGTRLIFGHQRRFNQRYIEAKAALDRGEIGALEGIYASSGGDLLTCGTHTIDLIRFFANDEPIAWVMGQIHRDPLEGPTTAYGHEVEQDAVGRICFRNGLRALMEQGGVTTGCEERWRRHWHVIVTGSAGRIEVDGDKKPEHPWPTGWRIQRFGDQDWEVHETPNEPNPFAIEMRELVRWIEEGGDHPLKAESGRADHEVLMAIMASSRQRARIKLPLEIGTSPLYDMLAAGEMT